MSVWASGLNTCSANAGRKAEVGSPEIICRSSISVSRSSTMTRSPFLRAVESYT